MGNGRLTAIGRWLSQGAEEEPPRPPAKRTWAEKVTDEANAWLAARRLELQGDFRAAADAYARDATLWRGRDHPTRAALSRACEARCLSLLGKDGRGSWREAAALYDAAAHGALVEYPHRAALLLDRAALCHRLAGDPARAEKAASARDALLGALEPSR